MAVGDLGLARTSTREAFEAGNTEERFVANLGPLLGTRREAVGRRVGEAHVRNRTEAIERVRPAQFDERFGPGEAQVQLPERQLALGGIPITVLARAAVGRGSKRLEGRVVVPRRDHLRDDPRQIARLRHEIVALRDRQRQAERVHLLESIRAD